MNINSKADRLAGWNGAGQFWKGKNCSWNWCASNSGVSVRTNWGLPCGHKRNDLPVAAGLHLRAVSVEWERRNQNLNWFSSSRLQRQNIDDQQWDAREWTRVYVPARQIPRSSGGLGRAKFSPCYRISAGSRWLGSIPNANEVYLIHLYTWKMCIWSMCWSASSSRRIGLPWRRMCSTGTTFWGWRLFILALLSFNVIYNSEHIGDIGFVDSMAPRRAIRLLPVFLLWYVHYCWVIGLIAISS